MEVNLHCGIVSSGFFAGFHTTGYIVICFEVDIQITDSKKVVDRDVSFFKNSKQFVSQVSYKGLVG